MGTATLIINGTAIDDIPSFYAEINRVFMAGEDWQLGNSLDALDDLLHGGYGILAGNLPATMYWQDLAHTRNALNAAVTRAWLQEKLQRPGTFNVAAATAQLHALDRGEGKTYFDLVMEVFAAHPQVRVVALAARTTSPQA